MKIQRPLYCYVCMECFQGSYCFQGNCVPCRKRVQRYSKFLNYKTFSEVFFEEILQLFAIVLNFKHLTQEKIFNILETFLHMGKKRGQTKKNSTKNFSLKLIKTRRKFQNRAKIFKFASETTQNLHARGAKENDFSAATAH